MDLRELLTSTGLLPPTGDRWPSTAQVWSPYPIPLQRFVNLTAYTDERRKILEGFFALRRELKRRGLHGVQWVDGSFLEHENRRGRPPGDLDVVTWMTKPELAFDDWPEKVLSGLPIGKDAKRDFQCDIYFDICSAEGLVDPSRAAYWIGLFGHTRSGEWKGFLQISLDEDEDAILIGGADAIHE
jgi:hypothetical protein